MTDIVVAHPGQLNVRPIAEEIMRPTESDHRRPRATWVRPRLNRMYSREAEGNSYVAGVDGEFAPSS